MWRNTRESYGIVAIAIHWVMALVIFFLFGLGLYMVELSYYDSWYRGSLDLHKSIGMSLFLLLLFRITWKATSVAVKPLGENKVELKLAHYAHFSLYLLMALLMISGYLISTADSRGIMIFGLFEVPGIGELIENQEDVAGEVHEILAWGLISLAVLHALAALKHHFIDKDATLTRMLKLKELD